MLSASVTLFAAAAFLAACVSDLPVGVVAIVWFKFLFVVCGVLMEKKIKDKRLIFNFLKTWPGWIGSLDHHNLEPSFPLILV
jgi:hypothetical protein